MSETSYTIVENVSPSKSRSGNTGKRGSKYDDVFASLQFAELQNGVIVGPALVIDTKSKFMSMSQVARKMGFSLRYSMITEDNCGENVDNVGKLYVWKLKEIRKRVKKTVEFVEETDTESAE